MYNLDSGSSLINTIFWGNTATTDGAQIWEQNSTSGVSDSVVEGGYAGGTNIITADPMLGTLGDYGGFTQTIPLLVGSSAINTGNNATCAATDQRGVSRPQGEKCDIGAYEAAGVRYAKPTASGTGDCSNWANACALQTALTGAISGQEIWAAAGTHKPTTGTDRAATFQLKNGVPLYGGFAGTETARSQRNPALNVTTLSGEIGVAANSDNSYHVVTGATGATLDGFTIMAGNANGTDCLHSGCGGGMYNESSSPTLANVTFSSNAAFNGGGMANYYSSPTLTNVTFSGNAASDVNGGGGGMYNFYSSPTLTNATFSSNSTTGWGGGMYSYGGSPTLTNVTFSGNSADFGGGMYSNGGTTTLTNVTFSGNTASEYGGGMINWNSSSPTLTNVTISGNSAKLGGGMYNASSSNPQIRNTIFWDNTATSAGAQIYNNGTTPVVSDSVVQGGCPAGSTCTTNIIITDPKLGTLGDHGGSTQTIPLLPGSSAIDTGNDTTCAATDQRGITRPQGAHCDIGAFEVVNTPPTVSLTNVTTTLPEDTNTNSAIKVADITITDDALGTNVLSLSGTDASLFEIVGIELRLKVGSALDFETISTLNVTVEVYDSTIGSGPEDTEALAISVTNVNEAPVITSNGGGTTASVSVPENSTAVITVTATDPDAGATQAYSISGGDDSARFTINATSGVLAFTSAPNFESPTDVDGNNVYDVTVQVFDGSLTDSQDMAVTVTDVNDAPVLGSIGAKSIAELALLSFSATATDADLPAQTLTFSLTGAPTFASITIGGVFTWTPTEAQGTGSYPFDVCVSDGVLSDCETITVTVSEVNVAPVLGAIGAKSVNELVELTFDANATDADLPANTITFSLVGAPTGASIVPATGVFTWTPTEAQGTGSYTFTVKVCDNGTTPLCDDEEITVTVGEVNVAPVLGAIGAKSVNELVELTFDANATDADLPANTITFSLVGAPTGASIVPATGVFTWTPTEAQGTGSYTFTVKVCDNGTTPLCDDEEITVTVGEVNVAPVLGAIGAKSVNELVELTFDANATDADLPANTITFSLVGAPTGASIVPATGVFTWTPTEAQGTGSYPFDVCVSDGALTDCETITVTVSEVNDAPIITEGASINVSMSQDGSTTPFSLTLHATDVDGGDTITWSISTPASYGAASASDTGTSKSIVYIPALNYHGSDSFVIQVSDGNGGTDTITVNVTITAVEPPSFTIFLPLILH